MIETADILCKYLGLKLVEKNWGQKIKRPLLLRESGEKAAQGLVV